MADIDWSKYPALAQHIETDPDRHGVLFTEALSRYKDRMGLERVLADMIREVELPQLIADVKREAMAALKPFADSAAPETLEPHPCSTRCWRVGAPSDTPGGICVECGLRASRDTGISAARFTEGQLRAAKRIREGKGTIQPADFPGDWSDGAVPMKREGKEPTE